MVAQGAGGTGWGMAMRASDFVRLLDAADAL